MHDNALEDRLRQVLRAEGDAVPLTITTEQLELHLRLRRAQRANRRIMLGAAAALVLAVGAGSVALFANRASTPLVGSSQSPDLSSPASTSTAGVFGILGDYGGQVLFDGRSDASEPTYDPSFTGDGLVRTSEAALGEADRYIVTFACLGPTPVEVAIGEAGVAIPAASTAESDCRSGQPTQVVLPGLGGVSASLFVTTREDTIWHVVVAVAVTASPSVSPSATFLPGQSFDPPADIAPYEGWQTLGRLAGPDGDAVATVGGAVPSGVQHLLISAACNGTGTLTIAMTANSPEEGGDTQVIDCPASPAAPKRMMSYLATATQFEVRVTISGNVKFQVLAEGSDVALHIPAIPLRHGSDVALMGWGCGGLSLAWGYDASDSCATSLPGTPLETLELTAGDTATVVIDGWTFSNATATCGRIQTQPGSPDLYEALTTCHVTAELKNGAVSISGLNSAANAWVLEIQMTATNAAGDSFYGPIYAYVHVR
jgi:hypothetical protein